MAEYKVRWEMDIEANSHQEAAFKALLTQRDPDSIAVEFCVLGPEGSAMDVDLMTDEIYHVGD